MSAPQPSPKCYAVQDASSPPKQLCMIAANGDTMCIANDGVQKFIDGARVIVGGKSSAGDWYCATNNVVKK